MVAWPTTGGGVFGPTSGFVRTAGHDPNDALDSPVVCDTGRYIP
jgi:hypothetical protein